MHAVNAISGSELVSLDHYYCIIIQPNLQNCWLWWSYPSLYCRKCNCGGHIPARRFSWSPGWRGLFFKAEACVPSDEVYTDKSAKQILFSTGKWHLGAPRGRKKLLRTRLGDAPAGVVAPPGLRKQTLHQRTWYGRYAAVRCSPAARALSQLKNELRYAT